MKIIIQPLVFISAPEVGIPQQGMVQMDET